MFPLLMLSLGFLNLALAAPALTAREYAAVIKAEIEDVRVEVARQPLVLADVRTEMLQVVAALQNFKNDYPAWAPQVDRALTEIRRWRDRAVALLDDPERGTAQTLRIKILGGHSRDESPPSPGYLDLMIAYIDRLAGTR